MPTILVVLLSSLIRSLITSICILAILLTLVLRWLSHLLRAIMELIANSKIVFSNIDDLLKSIIMTMYLDRVSYNRLDTIVMTHNLDWSNNTKLRHIMTTRCLSINLIVVARYDNDVMVLPAPISIVQLCPRRTTLSLGSMMVIDTLWLDMSIEFSFDEVCGAPTPYPMKSSWPINYSWFIPQLLCWN